MTNPPRLPKPASAGDLRLADFIRLNVEPIVAEWISFARTRTPASDDMTRLALQDHIKEILQFLADDIEAPQTKNEQVDKSHGLGPPDGQVAQSAAELHAALRLTDGFDIDQMVSEYRALRASVVKQWTARNQALAATDVDDLTRFNEAIDQAVTESVAHYTKVINHSRNLFLGILGHDLRNPIGAASMVARAIVRMGAPDSKQTILASQIVDTTDRATEILNDLLDITRSAFGTEVPLVKAPMDMGELGVQLVDEMRALSTCRRIEINIVGDVKGEWDRSRMGQVFSNLIGNAIQYSRDNTDVVVSVADYEQQVLISVHNSGDPIPADQLGTIFNSMIRGRGSGSDAKGSTHLGLGLYITKKIVTAHGGEISVRSTANSGTTFTILLPR